MPLFLLLLLAAWAVTGFYAYQNGGTHDYNLFNWHWTGVNDWVPVAIAAGVTGAIALLAILYGMSRIAALKRRNLMLRRELETRAATPAVAEGDVRDREVGATRGRREGAVAAEEERVADREQGGAAPSAVDRRNETAPAAGNSMEVTGRPARRRRWFGLGSSEPQAESTRTAEPVEAGSGAGQDEVTR